MGEHECSGNDGYDDRSRCLGRETQGPRLIKESSNSWCLRVGSGRKRSSRILANNNREHTRDLRVKSSYVSFQLHDRGKRDILRELSPLTIKPFLPVTTYCIAQLKPSANLRQLH